ncbi:CotS family spore coat protein [Robertmurraya sp. FSL R5-0851]|uniref:CotS family spore coat protein n=1 Tax=Robertmurraya sp. FSL R5-0851 TaxID=2921584 RepID=UPI0030F9A992
MHDYIIEPWDHLVDSATSEADLEQYVPPELEQLAYEVISKYDMTVSDMTLITSKPDKGGAIWKIETNHGPRSIKVLHRQPTRSLFSIGAQVYVVQQGARVPALIPTKDNSQYVEAGGKAWIVTDWVTPLEQVTKIDLEGAAPLCYGLGEFHRHTKGYIPPKGAAKSSRLYRWDQYYEKMIQKIGWFRDIALAYPETVASPHLLSVVDKFELQALDMFKRFKDSAYRKMIAKGEANWGLAHQDYGWSNGQQGPGGIWVIDLDGVSYDLPIRDLRKIITSTMDDMGTWDLEWIRGVIDAYHQANPIDQETFELLWIDMAFPNEFYKHVKEVVFEPVTFMNTELDAILDRITQTESNKWEVLSELAKDKEKYAPGDYTETEEIYHINPREVVLADYVMQNSLIDEDQHPKVKAQKPDSTVTNESESTSSKETATQSKEKSETTVGHRVHNIREIILEIQKSLIDINRLKLLNKTEAEKTTQPLRHLEVPSLLKETQLLRLKPPQENSLSRLIRKKQERSVISNQPSNSLENKIDFSRIRNQIFLDQPLINDSFSKTLKRIKESQSSSNKATLKKASTDYESVLSKIRRKNEESSFRSKEKN